MTRESKVNRSLFSSTTDEWPTPKDIFATLDAEFDFTLDPCATAQNAKCDKFYTEEDDGLSQPWFGRVFMNPPYGRAIGDWVKKAWWESQLGATVVCLIPARTCTGYWHDYVMRAAEIRLIRGRLRFESPEHEARQIAGDTKAHNAPFPSCVVVFRYGDAGLRLSAINRDGSAA